ncbi:MAG: hypothetical protein IT286_02955 [Proteobacteria bacterium]|nr:hypothetical protein [Pseudomonadota bacterium]
MKKLIRFTFFFPLMAVANQNASAPFNVDFLECKGINHSMGEYRISGKITGKSTQAECAFNWFVGKENEQEAYEFDLSDCDKNISGYLFFKYASDGFTVYGKLNTKPETTFHQHLTCY